ncbi:unnamed protein product [Symbiodinium sp. CCMP2592]|nr:unnamed protein product [Symbiodinium sp. CCMP2592]
MSGVSRGALEDHLRSLIGEHPRDTGPQLLWRLERQGFPLDPFQDAAHVRAIARKIKGPLPDPAAGLNGAFDQLVKMKAAPAGRPDLVSMTMSMGGGPKGPSGSIRGRKQRSTDGIADWPDYFLDEFADVHGKNLEWFSEEKKALPSSKGKSQRERNERRKAKQRASASSEVGGRESTEPPAREPTHNDELYIWLIDAYRMRCHDDLQWRGGIRRGIYEQMTRVVSKKALSDLEHMAVNGVQFVVERETDAVTAFPTALSVAQDSFVYCKLVEQREKYPPVFDFERLLSLARKLLPKRFQKDHAKFKYGDENAMTADRPSLRRFAESIYGTTIQQMHEKDAASPGGPDTGRWFHPQPHEYNAAHRYPPDVCRLWESVERFFEAGVAGSVESRESSPARRTFLDNVELLFADVGGIQLWRELVESLDLVGDNFGLPHVSHLDQHVPPGSTVVVKSLRGVQPIPPNYCRPVDLNGALGTLRKVVPGSNGGEIRFQVVIGDGTEVALKSQKLELNIEKKGEMSAYAKMMLNTAGRGELAADIGGYSSLSESEEEGSAASRPSARSAAFRRQRGLENIGEARRLEEGSGQQQGLEWAQRQGDRKEGDGEGREGDEARFVVELDGECKEQKVVKRRHLQFVDAREAWEHEHAASSSSAKGRGKGAQPPSRSDAAEPKPGIGKETSEAKRKPKAKAQVKAAPKATEPDWKKVFPAEDSIRLRDLLQEEVSMGSGSRISARKLEELLRERHSALLDVAKRYVDAVFRSRSKKQAKLDRHQGLTGRTHWLGRFAVLEKLESDFRFDFQANAFCRGHGDDGQTEEDVPEEGDAAKAPPELPEEQKSAEPEVFEPAPERAVHRFYGFEAGSIFFIPPCELYFTQDSIKSGFKDNGSFGHSSGYSSSDSPGPARDSVKTSSVREMFDAILERRMLKREVEMMDVVFHEGYYYSICNRRLAVYLLLWLCGRCPRLKVQLVSKTDRKVHWDRRFTTECDGDWILIRQTGEAIGRRFQALRLAYEGAFVTDGIDVELTEAEATCGLTPCFYGCVKGPVPE